MKPAPFGYVAAASVADAVGLLGGDREARLLAGGQSLVPAMCRRLARPSVLVDINKIEGLGRITAAGGRLLIGATCRHRDLERSPEVRRLAPAVAQAASLIGNPHVRNRGTIGGSLAHADPAAELPAALVASGATVHVAGPAGERTLPAAELILGPGRTALDQGEMLTAVELAAPAARTGGAFREFALRPGDFPLAGVAAMVRLAAGGGCLAAGLACCGLGGRPVDLGPAVAVLVGARAPGRALLAAVAAAVGAALDSLDGPPASHEVSPAYGRELAQLLAVEAVAAAWRQAVAA
jgi:CO/xanthine dehydrogenase FAD-binding subunit